MSPPHTHTPVVKLRPPALRDITDDDACIDELRVTFRFFASVLVRRAQKVTEALVSRLKATSNNRRGR